MKIAPGTISVLGAARIEGVSLFLTGQLDRKAYQDVNKVLEAIGGKWSRSAKAHVFQEDPEGLIEEIVLTGEYSRTKQDLGQFDTPPDLAAEAVSLARLSPGMRVLEPSAGVGNIAREIATLGCDPVCCEIDPKRAGLLRGEFSQVREGDFLRMTDLGMFDRVVMNPPFAKQADIAHVSHALGLVRPEGRLVAIMSAGVLFRENEKTRAFREKVSERGGSITRVPAGAFRASGTDVSTVIVEM